MGETDLIRKKPLQGRIPTTRISTADPSAKYQQNCSSMSTSKDLMRWPHQMRYSLLFSSSSSSKDVTLSVFFVALESVDEATLHPLLETMGLGLINDRLSSRSNFSLASLVNLKRKAQELQKQYPYLSAKIYIALWLAQNSYMMLQVFT